MLLFRRATACIVALSCLSALAGENDWPQWRGPQANGVAPKSANPPLKWSDSENVRWKVRLGDDGSSTPIVWGEKLFVQTVVPASGEAKSSVSKAEREGATGKGPAAKGGKGKLGATPAPTEPYQYILLCLDRDSGKTVWRKVAKQEVPHEGHRAPESSFATASPITDGEHVISFFGSRGVFCFDMGGNLQWEKDLGDQDTRNGFGEGATPALYGDTLVIPWDHEGDDFIVALDKRTGKEKWRQPRNEATSWATPLVVVHAGKPQVVTAATSRIRSYDLETGKQIWESEGLTTNAIPSPVTKDGVVYATSGYQGSKLFAIRLGKTGDLSGTDAILWRVDRGTPYVPSPLLSGDRLYFFASNNAILSCYDIQAGQPFYSGQRVEGLQSAYSSPIAAAGRVYLVGRFGATVIIKDSEAYEVLATNTMNESFDGSPVAIGNQLFLRGRENLYCIAEN
jgi:outer membrane protein assembly factor BamB